MPTERKENAGGIFPVDGRAGVESLRHAAAALTTAALRAELARLLGFTAENLARLAVVVAELEGRGEDLSDLKIGLLPILRQIAEGTLLPEVVVMFAGQPGAIKVIGKMAPDEQRRYAAGEVKWHPSREKRMPVYVPAEPAPRHGGQCPGEKKSVDYARSARIGNPKDIGDMAAQLILECPDRGTALWAAIELMPGELVPRAAADLIRAALAKLPKPARRPSWDRDGD